MTALNKASEDSFCQRRFTAEQVEAHEQEDLYVTRERLWSRAAERNDRYPPRAERFTKSHVPREIVQMCDCPVRRYGWSWEKSQRLGGLLICRPIRIVFANLDRERGLYQATFCTLKPCS